MKRSGRLEEENEKKEDKTSMHYAVIVSHTHTAGGVISFIGEQISRTDPIIHG